MADDLRRLRLSLESMSRKLGDNREMVEDALEIIELDIERRIDRGVDIEGEPFAPLSPAYKKRKEKTHPGQAILKRTRTMISGKMIQKKVSVWSGQNRSEGRIKYLTKYAKYHQEGGKKLPKRAFAGITEDALREIDKSNAEHLRDMLKNAHG